MASGRPTTAAEQAAIDSQQHGGSAEFSYGSGYQGTPITKTATPAAGAKKSAGGTNAIVAPTPKPDAPAIKYSIVPQNAAPASSPNGAPSILPDDNNLSDAEKGARSAESYLSDPSAEGGLGDQEYRKSLQESQGIIDSNDALYDSEVKQAEKVGETESSSTGSALVAAGLIGSTAAGSALGKTREYTEDKINTINASRAAGLQKILNDVKTAARANAQTDASNMIANRDKIKADSTSAISNMAKAGMDWQKFKTSFPEEYSHLADSVGGENQAQAIFAMNKSPADVVSSYTQGSQYIQLVRDPVSGAVSAQTFDLGITPPTGWVTQKLGTTATILQDPNNPANTIIYSVDPLSGSVSVTGTGTGQEIANQHDSNTTPPAANAGGNGSASTTVSSILGVDPATPLSDVIANVGIGSLVSAMIKNEGSSPEGVQNNPGNIKFTGAPGQVDSGVKASDGGTFASYSTPEAGAKEIAKIIQNASDGKSSAYGANPTLDSFVGKYTNTGSAIKSDSSSSDPTPGLDVGQYGLLANVPGFNPQHDSVDSAASNYLNEYLTQGKVPSPTSIGISTRTGSGAVFNKIAQRASDLYFKATGQHLPDLTLLSSNKKLLSGNNSILNTLNLQEKTIDANAKLLLKNLNGSNVNQNAPIINGFIDSMRNALGDPDVASYLAQNATISNELGSLLSLKNAAGTTVHDKLEAAGIIDKNDSADQIASKIKVLMQEAENGRTAIRAANESLYGQVDPLGLNPNNPAIQPGYQDLKAAGAENNYDGTWSITSNGVDYNIVPHSDGTYTYTKK